MPAYSAPIEVVQAALHRIGEEEITSLDDDSSGARVASSNYEGIVRSFFARHAWTFAKQTLDLTYAEEVELGAFTHAFVWPSTVTNIRCVMYAPNDSYPGLGGRRLRAGEYAIEGDRLLAMCDTPLQVVATTRAEESMWPGDFSEAVVVRMQGLFLEALCDKPQDARLKIRDADLLMRDAITRDKRQEPGVNIEFVPLAEAWRGSRPSRLALRG